MMARRRALAVGVAVTAILAFVLGAQAGGAAGPAPEAAAVLHVPVAGTGPIGRRALDGIWTVRVAPGRRRERVRLPYSPNAVHVSGPEGAQSFAGQVAWYRTTVTVAEAGDYAIRFESVQHRATVWVDGRRVARHTGAYLPFEARVPLAAGRHALLVRADWRSPERMKAAAWHRTWFNFGGINREVTIRRLGPSELDSPGVVTRLRGGAALVDVTVRVRNRSVPRVVRATGAIGGQPFAFPAVRLARNETRWVRARVRIERPELWAPGHPALYELRLTVPGESGWRSLVGLREIGWKGGRLTLNGERLVLHGASLQEDAPTRGDALLPGDMDAVVARLQAIGANATRSQHPLNPALLERLDRAGILVWQGVGPVDAPGAWTSRTPAQQRRAVRRVRLDIMQARTHPSVLTWNLANEIANDGHDGGQPQYVEAAAAEAHRIDPGRPVALDVWGTHMPERAGPMYRGVDAIGGTNYEGWYANLHGTAESVRAGILDWLARLRAAFPGKALVVTEFGAEANDLNAADAPGGEGFQASLLAEHIRVYRSQPWLNGMLVWNIQDFALSPTFAGGSIHRQAPGIALVQGINQKGLFTYDGRPKPAAAVVRSLYAGVR
ncbi:MAG: beta-galactosidase [Solirubrobacteraceae bacterium]|nr:beta-galactosidase [Solirubrobacteraceae bacterium]